MNKQEFSASSWRSNQGCINTTSGIITLKTIEWSKITKIARAHRNLIVHRTLTINDKILVNYLNVVNLIECFVSL